MLFKSLLTISAAVASVSAHALHFTGELDKRGQPAKAQVQGFGKDPAEFAPLPKTAKGTPIDPKTGVGIEHWGGGCYFITDGSYTTMFLEHEKGVILVDAPPTMGHRLAYAIGNLTHGKEVTHVIYSHAHADHIGGAFLFTGYGNSKNITIVSHAITHTLIAARQDPMRPPATQTFEQEKRLIVGNQTLELAYKGINHEPGNIFIWAKKQKALMIVDIIFPGWVPFAELAQSDDLPSWIECHDQILEYPFKHFVTGHMNRPATRKDVLIQKEYVNDLFDNCKKVIEKGLTDDPVLGAANLLGPIQTKYPGNGWAAFKVYLDTTAQACANMTNEKWAGKLGGWDVFGVENAYKMIENQRIDWNIMGPFGVTN